MAFDYGLMPNVAAAPPFSLVLDEEERSLEDCDSTWATTTLPYEIGLIILCYSDQT